MTPENLRKMTKAELLNLAKRNGLKVTSLLTKNDLIEALLGAEKQRNAEPAARQKPKSRGTVIPADEKRVKAAKEAAIRFIAGVRETPRSKTRIAPRATTERPAAAPAKAAMPKTVPAKVAPPKVAPPKATPPKTAPPNAAPPKEITAKAAPIKEAPAKPTPAAKAAAPAPVPKAPKAKAPAKATKPAGKKPAARKGAESERAAHEPIRQAAEEGKYYLGAEQRIMPPVEAIGIPKGYHVDRIVAMVRDPYWIFAYWEVTDHKYRELERAFGDTWSKCKMILRIYDKTNEKPAHFDIALTREAQNWYINVSAERRYQIAIGAFSPDGRFELVAISNIVETPSGRVSDRIDEQWMIPDAVFNKIFAASGGYDMHSASGELKALLEKRLLEEISSGAVSSFGSGALFEEKKGRAFRLWVATELILYGGTEPDAHVTVQGKEIKIRPDGTFSVRFALPDGKLDLPVTAVSGDEREDRTIETNVAKKSAKKEPVLR